MGARTIDFTLLARLHLEDCFERLEIVNGTRSRSITPLSRLLLRGSVMSNNETKDGITNRLKVRLARFGGCFVSFTSHESRRWRLLTTVLRVVQKC